MVEKLSDWFEGELYTEGANVQNRFTGEEITLNAEELSVYDFVMGCEIYLEMQLEGDDKLESSDIKFLRKNMRKGLKWFQSTNPEAYKILLE
tara:strand:- start:678 stop:953 length:276 start_codon:yes stop_codon:yes gene_type:complete